MPDKKGAVPILAPDGKVYMIPPDQVAESVMHGGHPALRVQSPGGSQHWISSADAIEAQAHGGVFVRQDGTPYPEGTAPVITGENSAGQPMWGDGPKYLGKNAAGYPRYEKEAEKPGFLESAGNALAGAAKGAAQMLDPRPTKEEEAKGLTSLYDYSLRPMERMVGGQVDQLEQAREAPRGSAEAAGHAYAGVTPLVGPWAAQVGEEMGTQIGEGNPAGAAGTLAGNAAVAVGPEVLKSVQRAGIDATRGRLQEIINPSKTLNTPVSPGDLTPAERFRAATRMGVNLDRAQATNAPIPKMAKRVTEQSLLGNREFDRNNAANIDALHQHAANVLDDAAPLMGREQFGTKVKQTLTQHRANLADEPGQRAAAQKMLDKADPRAMGREEFGDAVSETLDQHRLKTDEKINDLYHDLDGRLGDLHPDMEAVQTKAKAIYSQNKRFYENHPELLKGADARAWAIIKDFAGIDKAPEGSVAAAPVDTWADLQRARSHLLDLSRGPEFLGEMSTGWIKQMTGAIDEAMTSAEKTPGLSAKDVNQFRQANSLYKSLKDTYDNPQNPFYWMSRQEGLKVADKLNSLGPEDARKFREIMGQSERPDLVGQHQRQFMERQLDPAGNGEFDLRNLKDRWTKLPKEQTESLLEPGQMRQMNSLADRTAQKTPYDTPGSRLAQVIDAPDGMAASRAMFTDSGTLRLTPEDVRQMETADPELVPQLRRQAMHRLFDPADNGFTDLRNFGARWNRAMKEPLAGLLTPEQMSDLNDMASVTKTVNLPSNPSGTAVVLQPAEEAGRLTRAVPEGVAAGVGAAGGAALGGPVGAALGAVAAPIAETVARGAVAKRLVDPEATGAAMQHRPPLSIPEAWKAAARKINPSRGAVLASGAESGNKDDTAEPASPNSPPATPTPQAPPPAPEAEPVPAGEETSPTASNPPPGATHEVLHPDGTTVLGHVVNGEYVPLE